MGDQVFETRFTTTADLQAAVDFSKSVDYATQEVQKLATAAENAAPSLDKADKGLQRVHGSAMAARRGLFALSDTIHGDTSRAAFELFEMFEQAVNPLELLTGKTGFLLGLTALAGAYKLMSSEGAGAATATGHVGDKSGEAAPKVRELASAEEQAKDRAGEMKAHLGELNTELKEHLALIERIRTAQDRFLSAGAAEQIANISLAAAKKQITPEQAEAMKAGVRTNEERGKLQDDETAARNDLNALDAPRQALGADKLQANTRADQAVQNLQDAKQRALDAGVQAEPAAQSAEELQQRIETSIEKIAAIKEKAGGAVTNAQMDEQSRLNRLLEEQRQSGLGDDPGAVARELAEKKTQMDRLMTQEGVKQDDIESLQREIDALSKKKEALDAVASAADNARRFESKAAEATTAFNDEEAKNANARTDAKNKIALDEQKIRTLNTQQQADQLNLQTQAAHAAAEKQGHEATEVLDATLKTNLEKIQAAADAGQISETDRIRAVASQEEQAATAKHAREESLIQATGDAEKDAADKAARDKVFAEQEAQRQIKLARDLANQADKEADKNAQLEADDQRKLDAAEAAAAKRLAKEIANKAAGDLPGALTDATDGVSAGGGGGFSAPHDRHAGRRRDPLTGAWRSRPGAPQAQTSDDMSAPFDQTDHGPGGSARPAQTSDSMDAPYDQSGGGAGGAAGQMNAAGQQSQKLGQAITKFATQHSAALEPATAAAEKQLTAFVKFAQEHGKTATQITQMIGKMLTELGSIQSKIGQMETQIASGRANAQ